MALPDRPILPRVPVDKVFALMRDFPLYPRLWTFL
jgi:hypothetical protein